MPALKKALDDVANLDRSAITVVKTFVNPPEAVKTTLEGVMIILGEKTDWATSKRILGDINFLKMIKEKDLDTIEKKKLTALKKLLTANPDLTPEEVANKSEAASKLCGWLHAVILYSEVKTKVAPLEAMVKEMNEKLAVANASLKEKQDKLDKVISYVKKLEDEFNAVVQEKEDLNNQFETCNVRLKNSEKLSACLSSEYTRWKLNVEKLTEQI